MTEQSVSGKIGPSHGSRPSDMPLPYDILRLFTSPQGYLVEIEHPGHYHPRSHSPGTQILYLATKMGSMQD